MLQFNIPNISISSLVDKLQQELVIQKSSLGLEAKSMFDSGALKIKNTLTDIEAFLRNAESRAYIRKKWPDKYNKFPFNLIPSIGKISLKILELLFRDQREVNFGLIHSLRESLKINRQLIEEIIELHAQISQINERLQPINELLNTIDNNWVSMGDRISAIDNQIQKIPESLTAFNTKLQQIDDRHLKNDNYLKNDLLQQKRLIALFLEDAKKRLPEVHTQDELKKIVDEKQHLLDGFYTAFEDSFRGSNEDIINRLKVYLPFLRDARVGTADSPILDVGCGRGEWLQLMIECGYSAKGLDINRVMIEQCQARGLEVIESDVMAYLKSLPDHSLGAVTGFHIMEHLPFEILMELFYETVRVLKPGGLTIFETPNPENLLVGSCNFYYDPTHRHPLPPPTIEFIANFVGLSRVQILRLHPLSHQIVVDDSELAKRFNEYFYSFMDYSVIGFKP